MILSQHRGMTYEAASREAATLLRRKGWYRAFEELTSLREVMQNAAPPPRRVALQTELVT